MSLFVTNPDVLIPDGVDVGAAVARTTHLGIGAHPDDLEILAIDGILACYEPDAQWFTGVTLTPGGGTPRTGPYANHTDEELKRIRVEEQRAAACIGRYGCQLTFEFESAAVKVDSDGRVVSELTRVLDAARPEVVYTHNLWDKHDTHVAVALRVIEAIRALPVESRPKTLYGVEVWRDLDWLPDASKVVFDCSQRTDLQLALINAFESQVKGAKRYDLAVMGRRAAHATYLDPHAPDSMTHAVYGVDMSGLVRDAGVSVGEWMEGVSRGFVADVSERVGRMS